MEYRELKIKTDRSDLDTMIAELTAAGYESMIIDDPDDVRDILDHPAQYKYDYINDELTSDLDRDPVITYYLSDDDNGRRDEAQIKTLIGSLLDAGSVSAARIAVGDPEDDSCWLYKWQEFFKPTHVGKRIVVKPSWEDYDPSDGDLVIEMDPGMAFGSGLHETTSMCIKALEKYLPEFRQCHGERPSQDNDGLITGNRANCDNDCLSADRLPVRVLDVGTGTGILAIAAALLGADDCLGIEIDEDAVAVAIENIKHNGLTDRITAQYGDLTEGVDYQADIIVANLMADLVIRLSPASLSHLVPGGIYITSGILDIKEDIVKEAIENAGYTILEVLADGEWRAVVARR